MVTKVLNESMERDDNRVNQLIVGPFNDMGKTR